VLAPATLAALPSTRAIPDRDVFCIADPVSSIQIESSLSNLQTSADPTTLSGQSFGLLTGFPQLEKTPAASLSGDCCLGYPKVKRFALERSPNVSHQTIIAQSTRITAGYLCDSLDWPSARKPLKFLPEVISVIAETTWHRQRIRQVLPAPTTFDACLSRFDRSCGLI
jgi:hypothetical protein